MRDLVCVDFPEGRAGRGACDVMATGGMTCQPVEAVDKTQHVRHEYVGDGKGSGQPFTSSQHGFQMLESGLEKGIQALPFRRIGGEAREYEDRLGYGRHLD